MLDPRPAARAEAGESVTAGVTVAQHTGDAGLLQAVRDAFVHAMDSTLLVCTLIAVLGTVLAVVFLPGRGTAAAIAASPADRPMNGLSEEESVASS